MLKEYLVELFKRTYEESDTEVIDHVTKSLAEIKNFANDISPFDIFYTIDNKNIMVNIKMKKDDDAPL
jgi:hypothetical protein